MTASWPFAGLQPGRYGAILADPPWETDTWSAKGLGKSPEQHYRTMPIAAIQALPVAALAARDCLIFLWATWPRLPDALAVLDAWGFAYQTGGPWIKRTASGLPGFGTGHIFRSATEPFLIGTRGRPGKGSTRTRNLIETEFLIDALRREHSRKPPEARDMVQHLRPGVPTAELFAREPWPGCDVWGNETGRFGGRGT